MNRQEKEKILDCLDKVINVSIFPLSASMLCLSGLTHDFNSVGAMASGIGMGLAYGLQTDKNMLKCAAVGSIIGFSAAYIL